MSMKSRENSSRDGNEWGQIADWMFTALSPTHERRCKIKVVKLKIINEIKKLNGYDEITVRIKI